MFVAALLFHFKITAVKIAVASVVGWAMFEVDLRCSFMACIFKKGVAIGSAAALGPVGWGGHVGRLGPPLPCHLEKKL